MSQSFCAPCRKIFRAAGCAVDLDFHQTARAVTSKTTLTPEFQFLFRHGVFIAAMIRLFHHSYRENFFRRPIFKFTLSGGRSAFTAFTSSDKFSFGPANSGEAHAIAAASSARPCPSIGNSRNSKTRLRCVTFHDDDVVPNLDDNRSRKSEGNARDEAEAGWRRHRGGNGFAEVVVSAPTTVGWRYRCRNRSGAGAAIDPFTARCIDMARMMGAMVGQDRSGWGAMALMCASQRTRAAASNFFAARSIKCWRALNASAQSDLQAGA